MAGASQILSRCLLAAGLCLIHTWALAQNEVVRERSSLKGIQSIGFTVNLESSVTLTQYGEIDVSSLRKMGMTTLRESGIKLILDSEAEQSDEILFLYLHVNTMDAGEGIVPFALSLYLYQPVKLRLNRDLITSSVTWESGTLGIASYDRLDLITDAAKDLLKEFITDYNDINSSN